MSPDRPAQLLFRVAVALIGVALLAAGATAVFVTDNGTGSAALVGVGAALLLAAGLWERLESFELGGAKLSLRDEARLVAASYELVSELPPGPERGVALEGVVAEARAAARRRPHEPAEVRQLFERGTDGERIYVLGLMQEDERLRDFAVALEAIEHPRSAFEQYHALLLAEMMLPDLTTVQRRKLEAVLTEQPGEAAVVKPDTDRDQVAQRILSRLTRA